MYLNKTFILGNLTRDPELKQLPNGNSVCNFSVATNRVYTDKSGQKQQLVEYHNIVVYGKTAENTARYMKKGSQILIEGRMQTRSWEKDGVKRYSTEVVADQVQFGSSPKDGGERPTKESSKEENIEVEDDLNYPPEQMNLEDIPF